MQFNFLHSSVLYIAQKSHQLTDNVGQELSGSRFWNKEVNDDWAVTRYLGLLGSFNKSVTRWDSSRKIDHLTLAISRHCYKREIVCPGVSIPQIFFFLWAP